MSYRFSESQRRAVTQSEGAALVLAGPGSGKTAVITGRIRYLIEDCHIAPEHILVITFTKAAAGEMRLRFQAMMEGRRLPVQFGTFHAIFFSILKHAYHYRPNQIISPEFKYSFLREILSGYHLREDEEQELMEKLLGEISAVKNERLDLEHYYAKCCGSAQFRDIFHAYEKKLRENRLIDFDDMLTLTYELLTQRPDHLRAWQEKFQYILVDEVQDMNRLQYEVLRMLAAPQDCLFLVGDDDQSIYQFRGARPELMRRFVSDYPGVRQLYLEENYRCGSDIVRISQNLISHNKNRFQKQIFAARSVTGTVIMQEYPSTLKENRAIIAKIREREAAGVPFSDMAVLFRTNRQSGYLLEKLMEEGIPFDAKEHVPLVYDHWIARDMLCYLKLAAGSRERGLFLQIMNRPVRYLSRDVLDEPQVDLDSWEAVYEEQPWIARRIAQLAEDLQVMSHMGPFAAMNYVRKGMGYEEFVIDFAREHGQSEQELIDVLDELQQSASGFQSLAQWQAHVEEYRARMQAEQKKADAEHEGVQILTLHGAKGLEFDTVFLPQLLDGLLPYKKAVLDADIEEERRLFYVGMTRAKNVLVLTHSRTLYNKDATASGFLSELKVPAAAAT
ncbi:MAG: ATP-dependent helicase [Lachnospiraceae bacterium]|nr:ATP-dependent helicase [Lachnospiraceae bacterium]